MFHVLNADDVTCEKHENLKDAKAAALRLKEQNGDNFRIFKWEWIWSTQTLDEAMKNV